MSERTTAFVGTLLIVLFVIRYRRVILGLLAALVMTAVVLGVQQLMSATERPAADVPVNVPIHSQVDQERG